MTNVLLFFVCIILCFSTVVLWFKFFGRGLIVLMPMLIILANILTTKQVDIFGISVTLGGICFAAGFLITDILTECYTKKDANYAVLFSILTELIFMIGTQLALLFVPNQFDFVHSSMSTLFSLNFRVSCASLLMFAVSNFIDVYLFNLLKTKNTKLWFRNNLATIVCNCAENFGFVLIAFIGIYDLNTIFSIAIGTSLLEIIVALCDTPFLYIATKINGQLKD